MCEIPSNSDHFACLGKPQMEEDGEFTYIKVPINSEAELPSSVRAHLYASTFIDSDIGGLFDVNEFRNP